MSTSEKESRMDQKTDSKPKSGILARYMKLDTKKKVQYAVILLIAIVILAIYFTSVSKGQTSTDEDVSADTAVSAVSVVATDDISAQLKNTLSAIEGAGRVEVMITYESSAELVPAISIDKQSSTTVNESEDGKSTTNSENTQSEVVTIGGTSGEEALVLKENNPEIKGVIVVAEGADDIEVRLNLLSAVQTILDVSPDKVNVYKMNK